MGSKRKEKEEETITKKKLKTNKNNPTASTSGISKKENNAKRKSDEIDTSIKKIKTDDEEKLISIENNGSHVSISSLNPFQSNWRIKAKVIAKLQFIFGKMIMVLENCLTWICMMKVHKFA